jgi:hypothetical protein
VLTPVLLTLVLLSPVLVLTPVLLLVGLIRWRTKIPKHGLIIRQLARRLLMRRLLRKRLLRRRLLKSFLLRRHQNLH